MYYSSVVIRREIVSGLVNPPVHPWTCLLSSLENDQVENWTQESAEIMHACVVTIYDN